MAHEVLEMELGKLRRGEMIAAAGGIALLISMFFVDWYAGAADISTPFGDVSRERPASAPGTARASPARSPTW